MITVDISRVSRLTDIQIVAWTDAERTWETAVALGKLEELTTKCGVEIKRGRYAGRGCIKPAGQGTNHRGYGQCVAHGGARGYGKSYGAALMAHGFAQELDVSPWEALLLVIRITAGRLRYIESVLATATSDDELEGTVNEGEPTGVSQDGDLTTGRDLTWWVEKSELERTNLAKFSKAAIDAGVAQLLIEKELRAGEELASTFVRIIEGLREAGLGQEVLEVARNVMRTELQLALGSSES